MVCDLLKALNLSAIIRKNDCCRKKNNKRRKIDPHGALAFISAHKKI